MKYFYLFLLLVLNFSIGFSQCVTAGTEVGNGAVTALTCNYQSVAIAVGVGQGSQRTYTGFTAGQQVEIYLNNASAPTSCQQIQWRNASNVGVGGWVAISANAAAPTLLTVPVGADRLHLTTTQSGAWTATSAILGYRTPNPAAVTVTSGANICSGSNLVASGGASGTVYWQNTTNNGTSTATASTSQPVTANGTYYFRSYNATTTCWGAQGSSVVTLKPGPTGVSAGADIGTGCGSLVLNGSASASSTVVIGTATGTDMIYPFNTYWHDARSQFIVLASELTSAGLVAGNISAVGFNITSRNGYQMNGFTIKVKNTNLSTLSDWEAGLATVYNANYTVPATGVQMINFQTPHVWDGTSNMIVEFCFDNTGYSDYSYVDYRDVGTNRMAYRAVDNSTGCSLTAPYIATGMPIFRFTGETVSVAWTSSPVGFSSTSLTPTVSPTTTTTYTMTATANGCSVSDAAIVTVNPPTMTGIFSACVGASTDLAVTGETDWTLPTGGTVTTSGNDRIHSFTTAGTFITAQAISGAQTLIIGGGGAGGVNGGGGGGAGGVLYQTGVNIPVGSSAVTIGAGASSYVGNRGAAGGSSTFLGVTAGGGGGGGGRDSDNAGGAGVANGGSGGGSGNGAAAGGAGSTGGNSGGVSSTDWCASTVTGGGGGAGGAAGAVYVHPSNKTLNVSSVGGIGVSNSISGSAVTYGVGGMGIAYALVSAPITGCGGNNYAIDGTPTGGQATRGTAGTANRGNGGGGNGGAGGSGIVIIRYTQPKWTVANGTGSATINELTGEVTGVTAGTVTVSYASPSGCTVDQLVTITAPPTVTLTSTSTTICPGNEFTLGGAITAPGAWTLTLSDLSTVTGTGGTTWSQVVSPGTTTTYTITSLTNGCNATSMTGSTTLTLPATGTNVVSTSGTKTCPVNGSNWVDFYDASGLFIGAVRSNGTIDLGDVTMDVVSGSAGSMYSCTDPTNGLYRTAYMGRSWVLSSTAFPAGSDFGGNISVRLPFLTAELTAMNTEASTTTTSNSNDDGATVGSLMLTKHSGSSEDHNPTNNCSGGITRGVAQGGNGSIVATYPGLTGATGSWIDFSIGQFSEMFLHNGSQNSPLPVKMTNFNANCVDGKVEVHWSTASEQNSMDFVVERSRNTNVWQEVEIISASGTTNTTRNYSSIDSDAISGTSYYRLRQRDLNGAEEIYGPIVVTCENENNSIQVYPNPTQGSFTVELTSLTSETGVRVQLTDLTGKVIDSRSIDLDSGTNQVYFNNQLESGIYLIRVLDQKSSFKTMKLEVRN